MTTPKELRNVCTLLSDNNVCDSSRSSCIVSEEDDQDDNWMGIPIERDQLFEVDVRTMKVRSLSQCNGIMWTVNILVISSVLENKRTKN